MQTSPLTSGANENSARTHVADITDSARLAEDAIRRLAHLTIGRPSMTPAAVDTARLHFDAIRNPALGTYWHLDSARSEVAHLSTSPAVDASDALQITQETPAPGGAGPPRHEDREPPSFVAPSRQGPAR